MDLLIDGRRAMLEGLIDYAGLFPPASLELEAAVAGYRAARSGPHAWVLGRFLCPTSRIEELAAVLTATMKSGEAPWSVGAVFDEAPGAASLHAAVFHRHMDPAARVTAAEIRTPPEAADGRSVAEAVDLLAPLAAAAAAVAPEVRPFLEVATTEQWVRGFPAAVGAIARLRETTLLRIGAKLRTGGVTADAFPSPEQVALFITASVAAGVAFKATAGLHHPVRHHDPGLDVMRHGFLNLLAATAMAVRGASDTEVIAAVAETEPAAFSAGPTGLRWRDERISAGTLRAVRVDAFPAYGSCSFDEPVDDLVALGILERAAS